MKQTSFTKDQNKLWADLKSLSEKQYIEKLSYRDMFMVLDRYKLALQLDMLEQEGKIKVVSK